MVLLDDIIKIIDVLLFHSEVRNASDSLPSIPIIMCIGDLSSPGISKNNTVNILKKLYNNHCISSILPLDEPDGTFGYAFYNKDDSARILLTIYNSALINYKQELLDKYLNKKTTIDQSHSLQKDGISFNDNTGVIKVKDKQFTIAPDTNEFGLCKFMFDSKVLVPIDWSEVYKYVQGEEPKDKVKDRKVIYDAMKRVNRQIREKIGVSEDFFTAQRKTIRRNY
jgi:hypothetical protein